jgi:hypothetical protein
LAQALVGPFGLAYAKHPASLPEIAINMFWHAKYHKDPANEWLRTLVFRLHADQSAEATMSGTLSVRSPHRVASAR